MVSVNSSSPNISTLNKVFIDSSLLCLFGVKANLVLVYWETCGEIKKDESNKHYDTVGISVWIRAGFRHFLGIFAQEVLLR